jgi:hypothetical protein
MPQLEELQYYFRGLWLLLMGRLEGFGWLDFSERGFWRSWWAFVFCLPPMALNWAGVRMLYLSSLPPGAGAGPDFILKLAISDVSAWLVSYLALAFVMMISGYAERIGPMIIAVNWLTVPMQWLSVLASLVLVFAPRNFDLYQSVVFPLLLVSATAHFMVIRQIAHRKALPATAFLLTLIVSTLWSTSVVNDALDIGQL